MRLKAKAVYNIDKGWTEILFTFTEVGEDTYYGCWIVRPDTPVGKAMADHPEDAQKIAWELGSLMTALINRGEDESWEDDS